MKNILLITGTDTGVGKTVLTCVLTQALRQSGVKVKVLKPIETGCEVNPEGELVGADTTALFEANHGEQPLEEICPYRLREPLAPSVAARREKVEISIPHLVKHASGLAAETDLLLIEGAGGLLVPLCDGYRFADFAEELSAAVLLVVRNRLGCVNHALLSIEVLKRRALPLVGYVLNEGSGLEGTEHDEHLARETNRQTLQIECAKEEVRELLSLPKLAATQLSSRLGGAEQFPRDLRGFSERIIEYFQIRR